MVRIVALAEPPERAGLEYMQGLHSAVAAAIEHTIEALQQGDREGGPIPDSLLAQARRAAGSGVGLDTVLRRYVAGHGLLSDFLVQEAEGRVPPAELKRLLRRLATTLDVLLAAVTTAYRLEERRRRRTVEQRGVELVERLLAGEPLDASELGYEMESHHLALVGCGEGATETVTSLARELDARMLVVSREENMTWAWLGTREPLDPAKVAHGAGANLKTGSVLAIGEAGEGPSGWRLSHRQARAVLPLAQVTLDPIVRYADVALISAILRDELLVTSLRRLYLEPLEEERDGGMALRDTLQAFFLSGRNISSAAALLGVNRNTVTSRLRAVEQLLDRSLDTCGAELETALRLDEFDGRQAPDRQSARHPTPR